MSSSRLPASVQLRFDLRIVPSAGTSFAGQHRACLDMAAWADDIGIGPVMLSEHHGDPYGFMCSPTTLAAAVLARTRRIEVLLSAALVPFHDPVRLAEQLVTLDCLAPGRLSVIVAGGYRRAEFEMAGIEPHDRSRRIEEFVHFARAAWTGAAVEWQGRFVLVTPPAATPGGPRLIAGGKSELGARRAARLRCPFYPGSADPAVIHAYLEECERIGYEGSVLGPGVPPEAPVFVMVAHDPEPLWDVVGPIALADTLSYSSWQADGVVSSTSLSGVDTVAALRASGRFVIVTPEQCLDLVRRDGGVRLHPLLGGLPPELAWSSLRLFEAEVLPQLEIVHP